MQSSIIHLLLILSSFCSINEIKPIKFNLNSNIIKCALYAPLVLLLNFRHKMLDHIFTSYSYILFVNKVTHVLNKTNFKLNRIFPLTLLVLLICYSYNIVPRNMYMLLAMYIYIIVLVLSMSSSKEMTLYEGFHNVIFSHCIFFICKF